MKLLKKAAAVLLAALMCIVLLAGCGDSGQTGDELIVLDGDYVISRPVAVYFANYLRSQDTSGVLSQNDAYAKALLENQLMYNYLLLKWGADEFGVTTEDEAIVSYVDQYLASAIAQVGEESFNAQIANAGLTVETYRQILLENVVQSEISNKTCGEGGTLTTITDEQRAAFIENEPVYGAKHILILANGDFDSALVRINEIAAELAAGADFDALVSRYNEDPGVAANPNGYAYTEGTMVTEFEDAVKALQIGGVSEPVRTSYGYHIIMRVAVDEKFDISEMIIQSRFNAKMSEYAEKVDIKYANGYEEMNFADFVIESEGNK